MLSIGNKKYRNLQEQVGYNTEEIEKIKDLIDGIVIDDKLVVIDSASGSLSEAQMEVLDGPLAFISYNEKVYLKTSESATELVFKAIDIKAEEIGSAYFNIGGSKVVITIATKVYTVSDDLIITSYSKDQIDTIIANIMSLLNGKANLNGANFTGGITAPSIIENMNGYSFVPSQSDASATFEYIYAGVVKNGNKLTFALCGNITRLGSVGGDNVDLGKFGFPSDIASKLYPYALDNLSVLGNLKVEFASNYNTYKECPTLVLKGVDNTLSIRTYNVNSQLDANTKYLFRVELTFLLSENLAQ